MRSKLLVAAFVGVLVGCGDTSKPSPSESESGRLPDFQLDDSDGVAFRLSALDAPREEIERVLRETGAEYGLTDDMGLETKWTTLEGLKDDGEFDPWAKWQLLSRVGGRFGRLATEEGLEDIETVGDAVDWIETLNGKPVVLMTWSPRCKTCPKMNEQIHETLSRVDARVFAVASSYGDTPEMFTTYRGLHDFHLRILPDAEQVITNALGADRTPVFVVIDSEFHVRYRGALDDDDLGIKDLGERVGYVANAVAAFASGKAIDPIETTAPG